MLRTISLAEARGRLTDLVHDVERGHSVERIRRGKPVAGLGSRGEYDRLRAKRLSPAASLRAWRAEAPDDYDGFKFSDPDLTAGRDVRF